MQLFRAIEDVVVFDGSVRFSHFFIFKFFIFAASSFVCYAMCFSFLVRIKNAITQMITDNREPVAVASPIGNSVFENSFDVRYTPGTRTSEMAIIL